VKILIAGGGGGVGASVAFNLLRGPGEYEVTLVDRRPEMAASHALDLEQVLEQGASGSIRQGTDEDVAWAEIVVVAAAAPLTVNRSRMVYLDANAQILASVLDHLPRDWGGVLVVVTNPVDPLCTWAVRRTGLDRRRVLGYTLNDSLRLRTAIGQVLGLAPGRVDAWMIGEHGSLAVALFDRVTVDGAPVTLSDEQCARARDFAENWYVRHVALDSGRSSTWTSGLGVARMVGAIATGGGGELWPASVLLEGEYGLEDVSLSVPVSLGPGGTQRIHQWELTGEQQAQLTAGAEFVRDAAAALGC
jgi:malate dehydrogenase